MLQFARDSVKFYQHQLHMSQKTYEYFLSVTEEEAQHGRKALKVLQEAREASKDIRNIVDASGLLDEQSSPQVTNTNTPESNKSAASDRCSWSGRSTFILCLQVRTRNWCPVPDSAVLGTGSVVMFGVWEMEWTLNGFWASGANIYLCNIRTVKVYICLELRHPTAQVRGQNLKGLP